MTLYDYINQFPCRDRMAIRQWLAYELGVSEVYIRSMANGNKPLLYQHAIKLEKLTNGLMSRHLATPDYLIEGKCTL